ncbi:hypothetical protein MTO96_025191 [Rhipicephalus appendiculatus]
MRPVTPPLMYQPMPGAAQQPQVMFVPPPQPQMAFGPQPVMYGQPGPMYASTRSTGTTYYTTSSTSFSGGYPNRRDGREWGSNQLIDYWPPRGNSNRGKRRCVRLVLMRALSAARYW